MKYARIASASSLVLTLALAGCGSSTAPAPMDPLTGAWTNATCFGSTSMAPDISSCSVTLTFTSSLDLSLTAAWLSRPATASYPGCTTTKRVTGQRWSTRVVRGMDVFTVTGTGTSTVERTGCVNATDDLGATPVTDISIDSGDIGYLLSNNELTVLSSNVAGTYQ